MGRSPRWTYDGALHHVTMRCNNKEFLFDDGSFQLFLQVLRESCDRFKVRLFNYCLMTNHVHLLFEVPGDDVLPKFMHRVANIFSKQFNAARERKGHLWEGRYLSTIIEAPYYFLRCMAYIDLNPVRARIVANPGQYHWSGHSEIVAENQSMITLHRIYLQLGNTAKRRFRAYSDVLRAEAAREPRSLARTLVVGGKKFVSRMKERFGIAESRAGAVDIDGGAQALVLLKPARRRKWTEPS